MNGGTTDVTTRTSDPRTRTADPRRARSRGQVLVDLHDLDRRVRRAVRGRRRRRLVLGDQHADAAGRGRGCPGRRRLAARRPDDGGHDRPRRGDEERLHQRGRRLHRHAGPGSDEPPPDEGEHHRAGAHLLREPVRVDELLGVPGLQGRLHPARADGQPIELLRRRLLREARSGCRGQRGAIARDVVAHDRVLRPVHEQVERLHPERQQRDRDGRDGGGRRDPGLRRARDEHPQRRVHRRHHRPDRRQGLRSWRLPAGRRAVLGCRNDVDQHGQPDRPQRIATRLDGLRDDRRWFDRDVGPSLDVERALEWELHGPPAGL